MSGDSLTFSQRHGLAPLPSQLRANELSNELRAKVWALVHAFLETGKTPGARAYLLVGKPAAVMQGWWVFGEHRPIDEWSKLFPTQVKNIKEILYGPKYNKVLDFLEYLLKSEDVPSSSKVCIAKTFEDCRSSWRVIEHMFVPVATQEEGKAVVSALAQVSADGPPGARTHLQLAAENLSNGKWADSVRESIHAVEATAKSFGGGGTLADALKAIQQGRQPIHPALLKGFLSIYGYTSDERGVRHAMVDEASSGVGEKEAVFMFGACASFAQYLIRLSREA